MTASLDLPRASGSPTATPAPAVPPLHVITDDAVLARPAFAEQAAEVIAAGGGSLAFHLRGPRTSGRRLYEMAAPLLEAAGRSGSWLLVNDRVDVALAVGARGVQLGARGLAPADARRILGATPRVGVSVHDVAATERARPCADFALAGNVFATPSHAGRDGRGTDWLRDMAAVGIPVIGIGGITPARAGQVIGAGAVGVAAQRGVWDAASPARAVEMYLRNLSQMNGMANEIAVTMNGDSRTVPADLSVEQLLEHLALQPRLVVVEQNGAILRREAYATAAVAEGDTLELVHFVGGG